MTGREKFVKIRTAVIDIAVVALIVCAILFFVRPVIVDGDSMLPNFHNRDYLFLNEQAYRIGKPHRGDVVVFHVTAGGEDELYIKRVIGIPGDKIDIHGGDVYVNGDRQDQEYTKDGYTPGNVSGAVVPKGRVYVLGDNRANSIDSRIIGTVRISDIRGRAIFRLFPLKRIGTLPEYGTAE
ncbi:MAG: signal peptidase I [Eubacteriaceae bacterium]|jgi:signal peptidase I|nr:signal peptidase I [Eubacteriaceae bacterium]